MLLVEELMPKLLEVPKGSSLVSAVKAGEAIG